MKWLLWILGVITACVAGFLVLLAYSAHRDFYFKEISELVRSETGYVLSKDAPLEFTVFPSPRLTARGVRLRNPAAPDNELLMEAAGLSLTLRWAPLLRLDLWMDGALDSPSFSLTVDALGRENWMTKELLEVKGGPPFELVRLDAWNTRFLFRNDARNEILGFDLQTFDLDLAAGHASSSIQTAGRFRQSRFFAVGNLEYLANEKTLSVDLDVGAGPAQDIEVGNVKASSVTEWIKQNAASFSVQGTIRGETLIEDGLPHGHLDFTARLSALRELDYLVQEMVHLHPDIGPVDAEGTLTLNGSDLDLQNLNARLNHDDLNLELKGIIQNLLSSIQLDLEVNGKLDDLEKVAETGIDSGTIGAMEVESRITGDQSRIKIDHLQVALQNSNINSALRGEIDLADSEFDFHLDGNLHVADAARLRALLAGIPGAPRLPDIDLSPLGPIAIKAQINKERGQLSVETIQIAAQGENLAATLRGRALHSAQQLEFDLDTHLMVKDSDQLAVYLPELPDPLLAGLAADASGKLRGTLTDFAVENIEFSLFRADRALVARGNMSQLRSNIAVDIDFQYTTEDPIRLEKYFPKLGPLQITGPLDLSGKVQVEDNVVNLHDLKLQAMQTNIGGDVRIDMRASPPRIYAVFDSAELHTKLVTADPEPDAGGSDDEEARKVTADEITAAEAEEMEESFNEYLAGVEIETGWMRDLDLYFSFASDQAQIGERLFENQLVTVDISDGVFTLAEYELIQDGKPISLQGLIDTNTDPPKYYFSGKLEGYTLENLFNLEENIFVGGRLSGDFALRSEGATLGTLVENLYGQALVTMGPLDIRSNALTIFSSDIITSMLRGITTQKEDQPVSSYQCAVLGIDVREGVLQIDKSFAMESSSYNLAGRGEIDLNTGYVDLSVRPRARKGLGLSLSTLVGGFRIKGHMATPNFGIGGGGLLTAMVTGYALTPTVAAMATNPATATILATGLFAKGIFDRFTASNFSCGNTLKRIERTRDRVNRPPSHNPHSGKMYSLR